MAITDTARATAMDIQATDTVMATLTRATVMVMAIDIITTTTMAIET
jgi:hypothetical protein